MNFFGGETRNLIHRIPCRASLEAACSYYWRISAEDSQRAETFHEAAGLHHPRVSARHVPGSCPRAACAYTHVPFPPEVAMSREWKSQRGCPYSRPGRRGLVAVREQRPPESQPRDASSPVIIMMIIIIIIVIIT